MSPLSAPTRAWQIQIRVRDGMVDGPPPNRSMAASRMKPHQHQQGGIATLKSQAEPEATTCNTGPESDLADADNYLDADGRFHR